MPATRALPTAFAEDGYAIVRALFTPDEVAAFGDAIDRVHADALAHGRSYRHGNLFYNIAPGPPPIVRMAQWPAWISPTLEALRHDPRWFGLLAARLGPDIKQIIHQIHWKPPGPGGVFAWHQDSRSRRPASAFRNLGEAYIQTGLAIDPHNALSGGLRVIPGSHRAGDLAMQIDGDVLGGAISDSALAAVGLDPAAAVQLDLAPGDVALWSPYLVHASGPNSASHQRRFMINGYVRAADCDRGEWAFQGGHPVPLGPSPVLVHFEALHTRPEPHYP